MKLIPAICMNEQLLQQVKSFEQDTEHFHLWWLGQSGYLLLWRGKRILIDPYLSDSLTKKYEGTAKPHTRMSEKVMNPNLLTPIAIVSSSHNHTDHLDAETLIPIIKNNPDITLIIPEANRQFVANRLLCDAGFPSGLKVGEQLRKDGFEFIGIPAAHNNLDTNEKGENLYMGYIIRFGNWTVYHSGDTLWFEGMEALLRPFNIDLALLPINGNDPARGVAGNLNTREAAQLAKTINCKHVIPCHYNMFTFNTTAPEEFVVEAETIGQPYTILEHGGHWSSAVSNP